MKITAEMVEAAAQEIYEKCYPGLWDHSSWDEFCLHAEHADTRKAIVGQARAALTAVAPLIAAAERAACAVLCEPIANAIDADDAYDKSYGDAARDCAAAIRARGTP